MKRFFLTLTMIFVFNSGFAQSFCDDPMSESVSPPNCSTQVSKGICAFNEMAKHYALEDTFRYECTGKKLIYYYKNEVVDNWKYDPKLCGQKLMLKFSRSKSGFQLLVTIPIKEGRSQVYESIRTEKGKQKIIFKEYKELGPLPYGDYIEKNCAGEVLVQGKYQLTDTASLYSYNFYDYEYREMTTGQIDNKKTSVKEGIWKYYDGQNKLSYQENYTHGNITTNAPTFDLCSDFEKNPKYQYYNLEEKISPAIDIFNSIYASLRINMHLSYDITHRGVIYYMNGRITPTPFFRKGKYKPWDYQIRNHNNNLIFEYRGENRLKAYVPFKNGEGVILIYNGNNTNKTLDVFQTLDFNLNGTYERRNCSDNLLFQGNYKTANAQDVIREKKIDPNTYKEVWVETLINQKTERSGKWNYYNENGEVYLEENYPGIRKWNKSSDYLCTNLEEESRSMTKNFQREFITFNTICDQLSLNSWISRDLIIEGSNYYFNGASIDPPENISITNYQGDYRLQTPHSTIEIYANTKIPGLVSPRKTKKNINYLIRISHDDGKVDNLSFSENKLVRQEMNDGQRDGIYQERQCNGKLLLTGRYCQIDRFHRDTIVTMNPNTYEEVIQIIESNKAEKKYGTWRHYDAQGILIKEEDLGNCE